MNVHDEDFGDGALSLIVTLNLSSARLLRDHFLFRLWSFHLELSAISSSSSESYSSIYKNVTVTLCAKVLLSP